MTNAKFFVLIGPSGAGKNTVQDRILAEHPDFYMPTGMWTRPYREGELPDSVRVSKEEFERQLADDTLTGVANVHGNLYGTPRQQIIAALARGRSVLRILSVVGVDHVLADTNFTKDQIVTIYLDVPISVLIERLKGRGDSQQDIDRRMETAMFEQKRAHTFMYHVNGNRPVDVVAADVLDIIKQELAEPVLPEPYTHIRIHDDGVTATLIKHVECRNTDIALANEVYTSKPDPEDEAEPDYLWPKTGWQPVPMGEASACAWIATTNPLSTVIYNTDAGDEDDPEDAPAIAVTAADGEQVLYVPDCGSGHWDSFDGKARSLLGVTGLEFLRAHHDGTLNHIWCGTLPRWNVDSVLRIMPRYHVSITRIA